MNRCQISAYGKPLEMVKTETPSPHGSEVLLRVTACGVCHSDLHYWQGGYNLGGGRQFTLAERGVQLPIVPGHETLGIVEAVGSDVSQVQPGDVCLVYPWLGCGACSQCAAGRDMDCSAMQTVGLFRPGGYATHLLVPHENALISATGLDPAPAATLACAGLTAYSALKKLPRLAKGDVVVVVGIGGVGLTAIGLAVATLGVKMVAVDSDPAKLSAAKRAGAALALDAADLNGSALANAAEGPVAAVLDFVGNEDTAGLALSALRRGGRYVLVGLYGGLIDLSLALLPLRNQSIMGSLVGTRSELRELVALVRGGVWSPPEVETRPLEAAYQSLLDLEAGRVRGRIVLTPNAP